MKNEKTGHIRRTGEPGAYLPLYPGVKGLPAQAKGDLSTENRALYTSLSFKLIEKQKNKTRRPHFGLNGASSG
jgi:hypothetical protein